MDSTNKTIIIGVIVIVVLVGLFVVFRGRFVTPTGVSVGGQKTPQGTVAAPGASAVSSTGQVVTQQGAPVKLDATPGTPEAPQQSNPIGANSIPAGAVKLSISAAGFSPNTFSVRAGDPVTITLTSTDSQTHVLLFEDASLAALAVGVGPGETRAITFNAPKAGTYAFHCDVPGHAGRGERGTMTVK